MDLSILSSLTLRLLGQNPEDGGCVHVKSAWHEAEPDDLLWVRDRWWGQQRGPSLLDRTAKHSILSQSITLKLHRKRNPESNLWCADAESVLPWPVNLFILFLPWCLHSAFTDMNYHFVFSLSRRMPARLHILHANKGEISIPLSPFESLHVSAYLHPVFFQPFYFSISYCVVLSHFPPSLCIDRISSPFSLTSLCPSSCLAFDINARNLNICSANAGVRVLIWLLCWWRRGAGGRGFLWERWKARRQPVNAPQTGLGVTNPSDSTLSAVSCSSWLIWSQTQSCRRRSWVVAQDTNKH